MMNRQAIIFVLTLALVMPWPNAAKSFSSSDLIGVWELKFDGRPPYSFSQIGFTEDGQKCVLSYEFDESGQISVDYYLNRFRIEGDYLYSEIGFSSTPFLLKGEVIKDRINSLGKDYFEVFMVAPLQGLVAEKHQRLPHVLPEAICEVVDSYRLTTQAAAK
ncbi:MAG: hypothetical protein K2W88_16385 [Pararheinheimera sp.]|nr:hypothetical protein [Rheinheimera sp.]